MRTENIKNYTNGWIIGDFAPTLRKTADFEIAHHFYSKGFKAVPHIHKIATEYNYIVSGSLTASGKELGRGDIFIYEPGEVADVVFHEGTDLIIVKTPSLPGDKYEIKP